MQMTECRWCGMSHGPRCPSVKAIEYFENGMLKRVEFMTPLDVIPLAPIMPQPFPQPPWNPTCVVNPAPHAAASIGCSLPGWNQ